MSFMFVIILLVNLGIPVGQNKRGDLKFIFNQAANIVGFGGDRGLDLTIGEGRLNTNVRQGALIAGERVGVDSSIGINEAEGVDLKNLLNFGSSPISSNNPAGQLLSFLERIKMFFATTSSRPSFPQYENLNFKTGSFLRNFGAPEQRRTSGETMNYMKPENDDYDDYYHNAEVEDEAGQTEFKTTTKSPDQENLAILNRSIDGTGVNATVI